MPGRFAGPAASVERLSKSRFSIVSIVGRNERFIRGSSLLSLPVDRFGTCRSFTRWSNYQRLDG